MTFFLSPSPTIRPRLHRGKTPVVLRGLRFTPSPFTTGCAHNIHLSCCRLFRPLCQSLTTLLDRHATATGLIGKSKSKHHLCRLEYKPRRLTALPFGRHNHGASRISLPAALCPRALTLSVTVTRLVDSVLARQKGLDSVGGISRGRRLAAPLSLPFCHVLDPLVHREHHKQHCFPSAFHFGSRGGTQVLPARPQHSRASAPYVLGQHG